MKFFVLMIGLAASLTVKAQRRANDSLKLYKNYFHPHSKMLLPDFDTSIAPRNYDNSVLQIPKPKLNFKGNRNGFDIYQSTPDNMFIIKPDSTLAFNMPVKRYTIIQFEPPE